MLESDVSIDNDELIEYNEFFKSTTKYNPYPYQKKIFSLINNNKSVVLRAPTGSGKTLAVIMPFLYSRYKLENLVDRIIYALPMRSLAFDLFNSTSNVAEMAGFKIIDDPKKRSHQGKEICITIQTGELQKDHFFEGDIIFTTIDQLLSGYLTIPVSLPDRLGNINIGSIIGSMVVFDEVHLLEFQRSFLTATEMMNRFKGLAQFLVMTATLTEPTKNWLTKRIGAEPLICSTDELKNVPDYVERSRIYSFEKEPLSSDAVIKNHKQKTLVLCNTVDRSQQIYLDLKEKLKDSDINISLLHSRFFKKDRKEIEKNLQGWFGKKSDEKINAILVSTQVVEAGIDISCNVLHTELAPANSLIQRAGRCARYSGAGKVFIYELEDPLKSLPYPNNEVDSTRKEICKFRALELDPDSEKDLVEKVHAPFENSKLIDSIQNRREEVNVAMDYGHSSNIQKLIREVDSVNILLTPNPEAENMENSWPELLSVPRSRLYRLKKESSNEWIFKIPIFIDDEDFDGMKWQEVDSANDISWLTALNPKFAKYSKELGLLFGKEGERCVHSTEKSPRERYNYLCESFLEHTTRVIDEARSLMPYYDNGFKYLAAKMLVDSGSLKRLILLACSLHDAGKLGMQWQSAMRTWQSVSDPKAESFVKGLPLAHTTYNSKTDWTRMQELKIQKGPHAAEGAYAVLPTIIKGCQILLAENADLDNIAIAIMAAIARHHGPRTSTLQKSRLIPETKKVLSDAISQLEMDLGELEISDTPNKDTIATFMDYLKTNQIDQGLFLYWLSVRILRLADQRATSKIGCVL
jgi:CRISPR-associated endonuclease/helicase Cas3